MELRNKADGEIYHVRTEEDGHDGFAIFAEHKTYSINSFVMHYGSLEEFNAQWEDVD